MGSSGEPARVLGALLTGTEAREIAGHLLDGDTLTASLRVVATGRRPEVRSLLSALGDRDVMVAVLRAIEGARSSPTTVDPLWTMPGHLAQHGPADALGDAPSRQRQVLRGLLDVQLPAVIWAVEGAAAGGAAV